MDSLKKISNSSKIEKLPTHGHADSCGNPFKVGTNYVMLHVLRRYIKRSDPMPIILGKNSKLYLYNILYISTLSCMHCGVVIKRENIETLPNPINRVNQTEKT